jgi:hypothetical protein
MGKTSDADLVEEIMVNLHPLTCRESEAQAGIHEAIEWLRDFIPKQERLFDRSAIKASAQKFGAAIAEVEKSLRCMQSWVAWELFGDPPKPDRLTHFQEELKRLRVGCENLVRPPNVDWGKRTCAGCARGLMQLLSKKPPTGTKDGPFRAICGLLYRAVSGKRADLKRACDKVLRAEHLERNWERNLKKKLGTNPAK